MKGSKGKASRLEVICKAVDPGASDQPHPPPGVSRELLLNCPLPSPGRDTGTGKAALLPTSWLSPVSQGVEGRGRMNDISTYRCGGTTDTGGQL